jgi:hypothetical protein
VEGHTRDVVGVAFEGHHRIRISRLDVVELHIVTTCSSNISLIGCDTQTIDLRFRVLDGARADPRQSFPKTILKSVQLYLAARAVGLSGEGRTGSYGHTPLLAVSMPFN